MYCTSDDDDDDEDWISRKFTNKLLTSLYNLQDVTTIQDIISYMQLAYNTKLQIYLLP